MDVHRNSQTRSITTPQSVTSEQLDLEHDERPYLLVDLRDKDEFRMNHIVSGRNIVFSIEIFHLFYLAHHYPAAMLSRCSNNESKELLIYVSEEQKRFTTGKNFLFELSEDLNLNKNISNRNTTLE